MLLLNLRRGRGCKSAPRMIGGGTQCSVLTEEGQDGGSDEATGVGQVGCGPKLYSGVRMAHMP